MSIQHKKNLPVPVNRAKTMESPYRSNLVYFVTATLVLLGVATLINVVSL